RWLSTTSISEIVLSYRSSKRGIELLETRANSPLIIFPIISRIGPMDCLMTNTWSLDLEISNPKFVSDRLGLSLNRAPAFLVKFCNLSCTKSEIKKYSFVVKSKNIYKRISVEGESESAKYPCALIFL